MRLTNNLRRTVVEVVRFAACAHDESFGGPAGHGRLRRRDGDLLIVVQWRKQCHLWKNWKLLAMTRLWHS